MLKKYNKFFLFILDKSIRVWYNIDTVKKGRYLQMAKTWTKEEIKDLILKNDEMVKRSVIKLYERQTSYEQLVGETEEYNGVGFNGVDSEILSSFAKFIQKAGFLTPKQTTIARKKLVKYSNQLAKIANGLI